jgi:hypothetical protein
MFNSLPVTPVGDLLNFEQMTILRLSAAQAGLEICSALISPASLYIPSYNKKLIKAFDYCKTSISLFFLSLGSFYA